jgi:hypothetical protein
VLISLSLDDDDVYFGRECMVRNEMAVKLNVKYSCLISGFRREVDKNRAPLGYYATSSGNSIPNYIQQDATLHSLLYLETALHISGGTSTHYQERMHLYLQHLLFVTPLLLPAAIVEGLELLVDAEMGSCSYGLQTLSVFTVYPSGNIFGS